MAARTKLFNPRSIRPGARSSTSDIWGNMLPWLYLLVVLAVVTLGAVIYWPQVEKSQQLQARKLSIQREIEAEQSRTLKLQDELYALRDDRFYVERMARDVLSYGREGETIFKFAPYGGESNPLRSGVERR
jgi:cell division protein FtsB